jgi:segregation and condensation protein A
MTTTYNIKLPQFEGPFDLLLFFIERDELDIHDIPISKITDDFLGYIRQLESLNIDLASEFILVAATLMRIKAKLLIPRKALDDEGNEIDPREELVARLIEYKRYKSVIDELRTLEEDRSFRNPRGNTSRELKKIATKALVDIELESFDLFKLMRAFQRVLLHMEDNKKKAVHHVYTYNHTVQGQQIFLLTRLRKGAKTDFKSIFGKCENRVHAVITFLALLELLNMQKIKCILGIGVNNFWLTIPDENDEQPDVIHEEEE